MISDISMEKVLEAIYETNSEHMPAEACESCGVLKMLGDFGLESNLLNRI